MKKMGASLLFFDTFIHDASDTCQLDLVQFHHAVEVTEIRVIPLGARVKADFPGGVRLGATNPSKMDLEFFVNDLGKRGAAAFESLGVLKYEEQKTIQFVFEKKTATDGLLVRGKYTTVTLAVYGYKATVTKEPSPKPPPPPRPEPIIPPPEKVNTHERIRDWLEDTKRKQTSSFDAAPPTEEDQWEKNTKPVDYPSTKSWEDDKESRKRYRNPEVARSHSREKSWDRSEKGSTRRSRRDYSREKSFDAESTFSKDRKRQRDWDDSVDKHSEKKKRNEGESGHSRHRRKVDDWDDRQSDRSVLSGRRPRTPPMDIGSRRQSSSSPYVTFGRDSPKKDRRDWDVSSDKDADWDRRDVLKDSEYRSREGSSKNWSSKCDRGSPARHSRSREKEPKELTKSPGVTPLIPAILSDDMEAISDDEQLLDLPSTGPEPADDSFPVDEQLAEEEGFEYEDIMSDEEDLPVYPYEEDFIVEEWEDYIQHFNINELIDIPTLNNILPPYASQYQIALKRFSLQSDTMDKDQETLDLIKQGEKLISSLSEVEAPTLSPDSDEFTLIPGDIGEPWIQSMELVTQLLPTALAYVEKPEDVLTKLYEWLDLGLDYEMAIKQKQPVYKIRHMKAGIRLASSLLQCAPLTTEKLLSMDIAGRILQMFEKPYMAISIRLHMIRAIDDLTLTSEGLQYLVTPSSNGGSSCYEILIEKLTTVHECRLKVALSAVIRKIHLMEICEKMHEDAKFGLIMAPNSSTNEKLPKDEEFEDTLNPCPPMDVYVSVESCLREIIHHYDFADQLFLQASNLLPCKTQFQIPKTSFNPYPNVHAIFHKTRLLETMALLISTPYVARNPCITKLLSELVNRLICTEHGLRFLASHPAVTSLIVRGFLQYEPSIREDVFEGRLQHLGTKLAYSMHTLSYLDWLIPLSSSKGFTKDSPDYSEATVYLNGLESIMLQPAGKEVIISVLGHPQFCRILLPYLDPPDDDIEKDLSKASCFGYAVDLIVNTVKFSDNIKLIQSLSQEIVRIIDYKDVDDPRSEDHTKLISILPFVSGVKSDFFSYDHINQVTTIIQENLDKIDKFPGQLITCLRILKHLTIPPVMVDEKYEEEIIQELKYHYGIVRVFSEDFHTCLLNLLTKICSLYQQPFLCSSNFGTSEGMIVLTMLSPILAMFKAILATIIQSRNTAFKDLTAIGPLVQTFVLLDSFPVSASFYYLVRDLQKTIIDILLSFTLPSYTTEGEEILSKSLWTLMMAEVFKHIMDSPRTMVSVMTIVTRLLPLNLPIFTPEPLTLQESNEVIRSRKLWSAHLYSLAPTIHDLIQKLGIATNPYLTHALRKMAVSLSDLSSPMALLIARACLDLVLSSHKSDIKHGVVKPQTRRVLSMLASLLSHAPTKAAVLHLLTGGAIPLALPPSKVEEKYTSLIGIWCNILIEPISEKDPVIACLANLMNPDNAMSEDSKALLPKEVAVPLVDGLTEVVRSSPLHQAHAALEVLQRFAADDHGFCFVKSSFDVKKPIFQSIFRDLADKWTQDPELHLVILKNILDFCSYLVDTDTKTIAITSYELSLYLGWKIPTVPKLDTSGSQENLDDSIKSEHNSSDYQDWNHPMVILEKVLILPFEEDEEGESIYKDLLMLIEAMKRVTASSLETTSFELPSLVQESLQNLFASRLVFTTNKMDAHDPLDWLNSPLFDDIPESEVCRMNLLETARKYTDSCDLAGILNKLAKGQVSQALSPQKMSKILPKYKPSTAAIRPDRKGRPYVAPMRGRNFARNMNIRSDPFRSRPPNTSRPPSLHVDDFVALESTGHQPTGPTGYNKISFARGKMMDGMRGGRGGRSRAGDSRGRFFHRGSYREMSRGVRSRGARGSWTFRDSNSRGSFRGASGASFSRGRSLSSPYMRQSSSTKDRFQGKYLDRGRRDSGSRGSRNFH